MADRITRHILIGGGTIKPWPADVGFTILRVFAGLSMALAHGLGKIPPAGGFIEAVGNIGLPFPAVFAWAAGLSELVGGLLLAVGLLTRPAALCVLLTMLTAAIGHHAGDSFHDRELALLYAVVALSFVLAGSGRVSIDRVLR
jgi:putative oxidoreductase